MSQTRLIKNNTQTSSGHAVHQSNCLCSHDHDSLCVHTYISFITYMIATYTRKSIIYFGHVLVAPIYQ